jgi:hypothetical protein
MRIVVDVELPAAPEAVTPWVESLEAYPTWTGLVHRVSADASGAEPAWTVELRARIGPLARSKRLRMVRAAGTPEGEFRFVRQERDGRQHSAWELTALVEDLGKNKAPRSRVVMTLFYGGANWAGGLAERTLQDEITSSKARLLQLVSDGTLPSPKR